MEHILVEMYSFLAGVCVAVIGGMLGVLAGYFIYITVEKPCKKG